jgi:hypothetical protein
VPVNACEMQDGPGFGPAKAPCADTTLHANSPNTLKKVGADITTTAHGAAGEFRDGRPLLAPGKPNRVLGHVVAEGTRVQQMTRTRPTVGTTVTPGHQGVLTERAPDARLLDAEVGPRPPQHQGLSTADTAVKLTAVRGYDSAPVSNPLGMVAPTLQGSPLQTAGEPVTLPEVDRILPAAGPVPVVSKLNQGAGATTADAMARVADVVPQERVQRITGELPLS